MQLPDWLSNVDLWSTILGVLGTLVILKYPVAGSALKWLSERLKPKPAPTPDGPQPAVPAAPDLFPDNPVLSKLVKLLLERLMAKHGVTSPASALVAELDADPPK